MATASSSSASTSPPRIKVKKEICTDNDTIKELAETAMNDILGWYGYDNVDRLELAANNAPTIAASTGIDEDGAGVRLKPSDNEPSISSCSSTSLVKTKSSKHHHQPHHHHQLQQSSIGGRFLARQQDDQTINPVASTSSNSGERRGRDIQTPSTANRPILSGSPPATVPASSSTAIRNGIVLHHQQQQHHHHHASVSAGGGESSTSEKDSSRESSKSPMLMKMLDKQEQTCQWCRKVIPSHQTGILGTTEGMIFCTEACFSQSRRASFKRAKTCDWCRHVRHAVSYVDFQDGASQLQFCSDKCLNQYKMQIFCNETQAHLEMNPHLKEKSSSTGSLITPELWMKNCKSCSISPVSDRSESVSPVPSIPVRSSPEPSPITLRSPTPVKKPLISVAPPSKLLSKSAHQSSMSRSNPKSSRKRRAGHRPAVGSHASASTKRSTSAAHQAEFGGSAMNSSSTSINNNNLTIPNNNLTGSPPAVLTAGPPKSAPNVQDLRVLQKKHMGMASSEGPPMGGFDGRDLSASAGGALGPPPPPPPPPPPLNIPPQFLPPPLNLLRAPFFPLNPAQLRFGGGLGGLPNGQPPTHGPPMGPPPSPLPGGPMGPGNRPPPPVPNLFGFGAAPPVTILVPYPIIVPLPLPIPVPIPVIDFLKAALPKEEAGKSETRSEQEKITPEDKLGDPVMTVDSDEAMVDEIAEPSVVEDDSDVPLDFTVGGSGKQSDRDVAATGSRVDAWSESEHTVLVESTPSKSDGMTTYALSTIVSNGSETVPALVDDEPQDESVQRVLPKFKITRLEAGNQNQQEAGEGNGSGGEPPAEETDIERERKEMVERSRPLRKRKRLVVQQHLHTKHELPEQPLNEGMADDQEYGTGIELRSGSKGQ
ncbi:sine oculis-binding protein homolog A-like isoform X3 [Anopheles stephensi]|uniref:sine oculis-binding protein homolog A-like isoform X1 n=1 Tax=Anopheles stephensi TaxID=30069 RepID=UPI001658756B|nr:sine oculis-binding protein homolog A-like isoform X1 [Anopheles stephensi]XP_035919234.1 sine oculis-binding protein homolog A-like isoform X1 [Anopheles stephensi]XP_035919235.1 sine oculis-binding protein homolog A-like isoform X1 [Anopheles stephensi]XP_035919236.1 sine oculis-binding protein homolog A-like isoform X1 [Anopheles stephensi]XP_035919237.1 sine oculis-binding protein homolog A-like isoform X1 [Anopheles stephensi]XP_035919238.1 sine oculis-binding protein homolog A-like is